jgi:hypothetical protein
MKAGLQEGCFMSNSGLQTRKMLACRGLNVGDTSGANLWTSGWDYKPRSPERRG